MDTAVASQTVEIMNEFYDPELYDLNVEGGPRLGSVYQKLLENTSDSVVEFGCGTGALLLPLIHQGRLACGIDRSSRMLEAFRKKLHELPPDTLSPELRLADVLDPPGRGGFGIAICANDLCGHLLSRADLIRGLSNSADHLAPGGMLIVDLPRFDPSRIGTLIGSGGDLLRDRGCYPIGQSSLQIWEQARYDEDTGKLVARFRYEVLNGDGIILRTYYRSLHLHPWRTDEIVLALMAVGFQDIETLDISAEMGHCRDLIQARGRRS